MKVKIQITLLILFVSLQLAGQSNIRFNSFWDNLYTINPAAINDTYLGELSMGTRKQWVNFPGSPATIFAAGTVYVEDLYTQFGIKVLADKIGYTATTDIDLSYAYAIYLNTDWQLNLGLSASFQMLAYDAGKINYQTPNDPVAYEKYLTENNMNADLGFEFSHHAWRIGASSQNILSLFKGMKINDLHANTNMAYAMFKSNENPFVNLGGGICGIHYYGIFPPQTAGNIETKTSSNFQAEMNVTAFFKRTTENNAFQVGAFYRTWHEMGLLFGIHFDKFRVYYSYDFNLGEIYRKSLGTHEIMLAYKLNRTFKCRNCWY
ncbi:MAG: PorP/SprF family type IX secretion system membrane protein [Paludibacter sp.]|nr:PorP/SprF family type IX secretion system membrane protein [Paludibacter sp.]